MKIGMILDATFPPDPRVENEALTLIKAGHSVHLFCFDYSGKSKKIEIIKGINIYRQKVPKHLYSLSALAYTIPYYHVYLKKYLKQFIIDSKVDALHIHDMQIARTVFWVNKKINLPVTLDLHENRPEIMKFYGHVNSFLGKLLISPKRWKTFEFKYIKQAERVITVTDEAQDYYVKEIPVAKEKFYTVPNTVRPAFYNQFYTEQSILDAYADSYPILYLGDTGLRRGLETIIRGLDKIIAEIPNVKIVLVGDSKEDHILKDLVAKLKYEAYVDFLGWQDFKLFQSYIIASKICICPIHKNLHHDTTYANKLFQYMAFGKPMVVSDSTAQKNLVERSKSGLIFMDRDAGDFADKIVRLYKDKQLYKELSDNALKAIQEELNWDILSKELLKIYE